ncbi:MAG: hypothetical protein AAB263_06065 [Planctomycetota bacterium]
MNHQEFIQIHQTGSKKVFTSYERANYILKNSRYTPIPHKAAAYLWEILGGLGAITGLVLFFFILWYFALAVLLGSCWLVHASKLGDAANALDLALENEAFYNDCVRHNVFTIKT